MHIRLMQSHHCQTDAESACLILLLFTVNNKVTFFFFYIHQCLVSFVSMSLHSWVQSVRSGTRVCKAHQGKYYLVGICWSRLLDFPGDDAHPCHLAPCPLSIPHFTRKSLPRSSMLEHLNNVCISAEEYQIILCQL